MIRLKDRGDYYIQMVMFMRGSGRMIGLMDSECICIRMVHPIGGTGLRISSMVLVRRDGLMDQVMRGIT